MSNELIRNVQLPAHLQDLGETGLENAAQFIVPPRLKIVQRQAHPPLSERFNPGDVVIVPALALVQAMPYDGAKLNEKDFPPIQMTPLFFFAEWATWNPMGSEEAIFARSFDPQGEIARKSRSKDTWTEVIDGTERHHCEHLVFAFMVNNGPLEGMTVLHSFMRSEHKTGSSLLTMCRMRKAPLYAQRFNVTVGMRTNSSGSWLGFNFQNPPFEEAWTTAEDIDAYKRMYEELRDAHARGAVQVDYNEGTDTDTDSTVSEF